MQNTDGDGGDAMYGMDGMDHERLSRREALAAGGAAFAAVPSLQGSAPKPRDVRRLPWRLTLGLNGFASVWGQRQTMLWEALEAAASMGFVGVELVADWPPGFRYPDPDDGPRVDALRRMLDRYGLRALALQTAPTGRGFSPDASEREAWLKSIVRQFELLTRLGGDTAGHWPGGDFGPQTEDQAVARMAESCRRAADDAGKRGVTLCVEVEPVFSFRKIDHLIGIVHGANHPHCKAIYDPSHFDWMNGGTGRPEELLHRIGVGSIGHVQFCDTDGTLRDGGTSRHLACGDGHIDVGRNLDLLWKGGYRGCLMLDCWQIPDQFDAIRKGRNAVDAALRRNRAR